MSDKVITRYATVDDVAEITLLMPDLGYPATLSEMQNRFNKIFTHPDYRTIVVVFDGKIVGFAGLCKGLFLEHNGGYMRILAFVIKKSSRNQGIAKILLRASEGWALEQGLNTVIINSGNREERLVAHAFYTQMGYVIKSSGFVKHL